MILAEVDREGLTVMNRGQGASRGQCSEVFRYLIFLVEAEEEEQDSGSESGILGRLEDSEAFTQEASVILSTWSQTWV